jgi:hypothetical protein
MMEEEVREGRGGAAADMGGRWAERCNSFSPSVAGSGASAGDEGRRKEEGRKKEEGWRSVGELGKNLSPSKHRI